MKLLRLYPRAWRQRYEAEMRALLAQHHVTPATRLDLLRGAADAWQIQWRSSMTLAAVRRGALMGVLPSVFVVIQFALGLGFLDNSDVHAAQTLMWPAAVVALIWFCLRAGAEEARLTGRLAAGAATGLVAVALALLVSTGLELADFGFGISRFVLGLQGFRTSYESTFADFAAGALSESAIVSVLALTLAGGALGAGVAALGKPLSTLTRR